jgi:hypothetical protein
VAAKATKRRSGAHARNSWCSTIVAAVCLARDHLVMERDGRKRSILWWRVAAVYGWSIAVRALDASPRWSPRSKAKAGALVGAAITCRSPLDSGLPTSIGC